MTIWLEAKSIQMGKIDKTTAAQQDTLTNLEHQTHKERRTGEQRGAARCGGNAEMKVDRISGN